MSDTLRIEARNYWKDVDQKICIFKCTIENIYKRYDKYEPLKKNIAVSVKIASVRLLYVNESEELMSEYEITRFTERIIKISTEISEVPDIESEPIRTVFESMPNMKQLVKDLTVAYNSKCPAGFAEFTYELLIKATEWIVNKNKKLKLNTVEDCDSTRYENPYLDNATAYKQSNTTKISESKSTYNEYKITCVNTRYLDAFNLTYHVILFILWFVLLFGDVFGA